MRGAVDDANFTGSDLRDADFANLNLQGALFSRANLYGADLTGAKLDGAVFGNARVDENTDFGEEIDYRVPYDRTRTSNSDSYLDRVTNAVGRYLPRRPPWNDPIAVESDDGSRQSDGSGDSQATSGPDDNITQSGSSGKGKPDGGNQTEEPANDDKIEESATQPQLDEEGDGDRTKQFRKAARAYHNLERVGRENSLPDLQRKGFVRRQEMHRLRYAEEAATADSAFGAWKLWAKWVRTSVARLTLLYGESPWRVIAVSIGTILFCGALYPLGGFRAGDSNNPELIQATSFGEWLSLLPDGIYFSTLTFTTLGFGDFQPAGWGRFLATAETALGATLLALLVFVLGRRAAQ